MTSGDFLLEGNASILVAAITCFVADCAAQELVSKVDKYMNAKVKAGQFSGSILLAQNGKVLVSKGYGMANLELNVLNMPQTKFRLGSLTKQFTAMGIMMLQERGKLNVQDPICNYVSECPQGWQAVTIHHLITHTSGILDLTGSPDFGKIMVEPLPVRNNIERFSGKVLEFKPGEKFSYHNINRRVTFAFQCASSASLILCVRASDEKGFSIKAVPSSSTP